MANKETFNLAALCKDAHRLYEFASVFIFFHSVFGMFLLTIDSHLKKISGVKTCVGSIQGSEMLINAQRVPGQ